MKKVLALFLFIFASLIHAQTTVVSFQVQDSTSQTWNNGTWSVKFLVNPAQPTPGIYNINGTPLSPSVINQSGNLDSSGNGSFTIYQTNAISPSGSLWQIQVCPNASSLCGTYNFSTFSNSTLNISTSLTSVIPPVTFSGNQNPFGYNDNEVSNPRPGTTYWNVSLGTLRFYTGAVWISIANSADSCFLTGCTFTGPISWAGGSSGIPAKTTLTNLGGASLIATAVQTFLSPVNFPLSNGVVYPLSGTVTDICTAIAAAIVNLPSTGGVVDARGISSISPISCSLNPFAANNASGSPKPIIVLLGPGTINTLAQWLISTDNMAIAGTGRTQTIIQYTGTSALLDPSGGPGGVVEVDSTTPASTLIQGVLLTDFFISGNTHAPYALLLDGAARNDLKDISTWNVTSTGIELKFAVGNSIYAPHTTSSDTVAAGISQIQTPSNGIGLDGESSSFAATTSAVTNPVMEFNTGCGIHLAYAFNNVFISGTSEGNGTSATPTTGNICLTNTSTQFPSGNSFQGLDLESATSGESAYIYGESNTFDNLNISQQLDIYGNYNQINNGFENTIVVDSGATRNTIVKPLVNTTITDNGTRTDIQNASMINPNAYDGFPWESRNTTWNGGSAIATTYDGSDFLSGQWTLPFNTAVTISNTSIAATNWHAIIMGQFVNNGNGTGMGQLSPFIEISQSFPSFTEGSCTITFSISAGVFKATESACTGDTTIFNGRIILIPGTNNAAGSTGLSIHDSIESGHLNQVAVGTYAGSCTMGASTSCTFNISYGYAGSPICFSGVQSSTLTGGASSCTLSGTTVTITAAVANSLTWGAFLIGNPN